jgi:hypothetical protein
MPKTYHRQLKTIGSVIVRLLPRKRSAGTSGRHRLQRVPAYGPGLIAVNNIENALAGVAEIDRNYP